MDVPGFGKIARWWPALIAPVHRDDIYCNVRYARDVGTFRSSRSVPARTASSRPLALHRREVVQA